MCSLRSHWLRSLTLLAIVATMILTACAEDSNSRDGTRSQRGVTESPTDSDHENSEDPRTRELAISEYPGYLTDRTRLPHTVQMVTDRWGRLTVFEGEFHYRADTTPWSSWWWPFASSDYFTNSSDLALLEKVDLLRSSPLGGSGQAADYHRENIFAPDGPVWAGLCDARAFASVYEQEPQQPALIDGICFGIEELKALMALKYEKVNAQRWNGFFGQRNNGNDQDLYADIYPDQLHRLLQVSLHEHRMPFLIDSDPRLPIWTDAVYEAKGSVKPVEGDSQLVAVELSLTMPDFLLNDQQRAIANIKAIGTIPRVREYSYYLRGTWRGDQFQVTDGLWRGRSKLDHPDFAVFLPPNPNKITPLGSSNPELPLNDIQWILDQIPDAPNCNPG